MISESRKDPQTSYKSESSPCKFGSLSPHPQPEISTSDDTESASTLSNGICYIIFFRKVIYIENGL